MNHNSQPPTEPTGQQPELTGSDRERFRDWVAMHWVAMHMEMGVQSSPADFARRALEYATIYERTNPLSRWRCIATDGLPGDEDLDTYYVFFPVKGENYPMEIGTWRYFSHRYKFIPNLFTHWRPIELPS